jgi:CDP-glucose 4,6-dehydratase
VALRGDAIEALQGRSVLLTGHTGFKGTWLALWLEQCGVTISGYSLPPEDESLYQRADLAGRWTETFADVRDLDSVVQAVAAAQPDLVIHMAAQPLVGAGYAMPVETFETNVIGTVNVLEAVRRVSGVQGALIITTDKVYSPRPTGRHSEDDALGGHDPYSASKSAAEHAVAAWRTLMKDEPSRAVVALRAGNVIGGGDFAEGRLVPDLVRAFAVGEACEIRRPSYVRPWQHVLDPLSGYIEVAARVLRGSSVPPALNFGPDSEESVAFVADLAASLWGSETRWVEDNSHAIPENPNLALSSDLANRELGWSPTWDTRQAVGRTIQWWKDCLAGGDPVSLCHRDIATFTQAARR